MSLMSASSCAHLSAKEVSGDEAVDAAYERLPACLLPCVCSCQGLSRNQPWLSTH